MLKCLKLLVYGLLIVGLASEATIAANGANLIGLDPTTRAMGGLGIGYSPGIGSLTKNPAWLTDYEGYHFLLGATVMIPDSQARASITGVLPDTGFLKSDGELYVVPKISIVNQLSDDLVLGLDLEVPAGFGVDHKDHAGLSQLLTNMVYARLTPSLGWKLDDNWSVGAGVNLGYGLLDINANLPDSQNNVARRGGGTSVGMGLGFRYGVGYEQDNWQVGASYSSPVEMQFNGVADFDADGTFDDFIFEMPTDYGVGGAVTLGSWVIGVDYKHIAWSDAKGFNTFQWEDQDVIGIGASWQVCDKMIVRFGGSFADAPFGSHDDLDPANGFIPVGDANFLDSQVALLNLAGVPAIAEQIYGLGLGYSWTDNFTSDFSLTYSPKNTVTQTGKTLADGDTTLEASLENIMFSVALTWKFGQ